ncbi:MAG: glycosyltransferase family 4 protein [Bacillota bacterium]
MKIGVFTDSYRPYTSGVVKSIDLFTRDLVGMGHEVNIFAPSYPGYEKDSRVFRFASVPAPTNPSYTLAIPFSLRLRPTIKRIKPDIIHVHSPFLLGRLGARYAKTLGIPLVLTFHTLYDLYVHYVPFGQDIAKTITMKYYTEFCNNCDLVIAPTGIIARHLMKSGVRVRIETIPTGIDLEKFDGHDKHWIHSHYNLPADTRVLLCVGRLGKEKNIGFLLDAYSRVLPEHPDTMLVLVGEGPEEENLKKRARDLGINDHVIFAGLVDSDGVAKYYCSSYLFVFASETETQGLVLGEAKAAGIPSVAVGAFGTNEMVRDGEDGFLTENNINSFVEKLSMVLEDDALRGKMAEAAKRNSYALSSIKSTEKLVKCYEDILKNRCYDRQYKPDHRQSKI